MSENNKYVVGEWQTGSGAKCPIITASLTTEPACTSVAEDFDEMAAQQYDLVGTATINEKQAKKVWNDLIDLYEQKIEDDLVVTEVYRLKLELAQKVKEELDW